MKHGPNIFEYSNYRQYLHDVYLYKKKISKNFSHRVFVRICGFTSPNFLKLVIEGKRNLGQKARKKILGSLSLNKREREYFEALILFDQAKSSFEKDHHLTIIARVKHRAKVKAVEIDQYEYLSHWHNVAIHELVGLNDFVEDHKWINKKLGTRFSELTIKKTIDKLLSLGLLDRDSGGKLIQRNPNIICEPQIFSVAVNNYHKQMIQKGMDSIEKSKSTERDISGVTISIDKDAFKVIQERIKRCREEIHQIASDSKSPDAVYQVNFQLFNLSEDL